MKILCIFLVIGVCSTLGAKPFGRHLSKEDNFIEGEYLIGLREDFLQSRSQEDAFVESIKTGFNIDIQKVFHIGKVRILYIKSDHEDALRVSRLPEVKYMERHGYGYAAQTCNEQPSPQTWGLDRIDQRGLLASSDPLDPSCTYTYGERMGDDVVAYIADSGIDVSLSEFGGRAVHGAHFIEGETGDDLNGHGTHCAGTVGSASFGVAKNVSLVAVKVLDADNSGPWADIIDGLEWILEHHNNRTTAAGGVTAKSVVNLSLGGNGNTAVDDAVKALIDGGVVVVIAAMNENQDACNFTPARVPEAITVAASDVEDVSATFTNWGMCVDIFGPGDTVMSTLPGGPGTMSGTSMATPHVVGVVARYQSSLATAPTPADVDTWLKQEATASALSFSRPNHDTSPNLLLYADC